MLQSLTSFVCCTNIATPPPPSWKSDSKKTTAARSDYSWCLLCIVQLTQSVSCVCITVALASASLLWRPALMCLWALAKHQLTLNSRRARLILCSLTAFYCFSNDVQSACLLGGWKLQLNLSSMENEALSTPKKCLAPESDSLSFVLEKSAIEIGFSHVVVACERPLSCKNVTHFLFHLQALHDLMKTEGQGVFCALSQHWLVHVSREQQ